MTAMPEWWMDHVLDLLKRLSDVDYQRRAWFEGSIPGVVDFPSEFLTQFLGDVVNDEYLTQAEGRMPETWLRSLRDVRAELDRYGGWKDGLPINRDTLRSERWLRITKMAADLRPQTERLHPRHVEARSWSEGLRNVLSRLSNADAGVADEFQNLTGRLLHLVAEERIERAEDAFPAEWLGALGILRELVRAYRERHPRGDGVPTDPEWQKIAKASRSLLSGSKRV